MGLNAAALPDHRAADSVMVFQIVFLLPVDRALLRLQNLPAGAVFMASLKVTRAFFLARNHGKQLLCRNKKQPDRRNSYRDLHEIHPSRL